MKCRVSRSLFLSTEGKPGSYPDSSLKPNGGDQRETAIVRRLDRLARTVERLERDPSISTEALGLFVKFRLTTTPPPDTLIYVKSMRGQQKGAHLPPLTSAPSIAHMC